MKAGDGGSRCGHVLVSRARRDRRQQPLVKFQGGFRSMIGGQQWGLMSGPEHSDGKILILLGGNQLVDEDLSAASDAGVRVVAEMKN